MRASYGGYNDLAVYLLNRGADKYVKDNAGRTAVDYVRNPENTELINLLK
jgi:ankyrin repeat protein